MSRDTSSLHISCSLIHVDIFNVIFLSVFFPRLVSFPFSFSLYSCNGISSLHVLVPSHFTHLHTNVQPDYALCMSFLTFFHFSFLSSPLIFFNSSLYSSRVCLFSRLFSLTALTYFPTLPSQFSFPLLFPPFLSPSFDCSFSYPSIPSYCVLFYPPFPIISFIVINVSTSFLPIFL